MSDIKRLSGFWGASSTSYISELLGKNLNIIVAQNQSDYATILDELSFFAPDAKVLKFPEYYQLPFEEARILPSVTSERTQTLFTLINEDEPAVLVTTPFALMKKLPSPDDFLSGIIYLKKGEECERSDLEPTLEKCGYIPVEYVSEVGEYKIRGDRVDIFTPGRKMPLRIEFFDDEVEEISLYDPENGKSTEKLDKLVILPAGELLAPLSELIDACDEDRADKLETFGKYAGHHWLAPLVDGCPSSLSDYLPDDAKIFLMDTDLNKSFETLSITVADNIPEDIEKIEDNFLRSSEAKSVYLKYETLSLSEMITDDTETPAIKSIKGLFGYDKNNIYESMKNAVDAFKKLFEDEITVIASIESSKLIKALTDFTRDYSIETEKIKNIKDAKSSGKIYIFEKRFRGGFLNPEKKFVIVSDQDIFGVIRKKVKRPKRETYSTTLSDLESGDHVVHVDYGIGVYKGIEHKEIGGIEGDYLLLEYEGAEYLYVPVDAVGMVQKYIGAGDRKPALHSLKSNVWNKVKSQAAGRAKKIAMDLLKLYADRKVEKGFSFKDDGTLVRDFEYAFEYDETDDQMNAITDVYADMENELPMERLVCGDVGFGKTEVAMRAACKAVACGKQVAILVPTTVLARQHYETFSARFQQVGVNVDFLSRLKTGKNAKETLAKMANGQTDIIIGTHRLLSKDIELRDLGLLIIDEEQRFGVAHKEKIKALKQNIDVLYLSATPIPRTLQLSLSGIRDISTIETPPSERLPVITSVTKEANEIEKAVKKELERGGQVYFLHNRVENIQSWAHDIKQMVPMAKVSYAHGQMTPNQLEKVLYDFYSGETDVMVSTTIIENGLDISNANTIIINNAANLGLAQIYQLKGRVGRSTKRGYCYLHVPNIKALTPIALKRLKIIQQLSDLSSGLKIAFYDLQLRGAGDLLGADQSGFIVKVGYELFIHMIEDAVKELKGEKPSSHETQVSSSLSYYLPADYIEDIKTRLDFYKKFSNVKDLKELDELNQEITERFGEPGAEAVNLGKIMLLKNLAGQILTDKLIIRSSSVKVQFSDKTPVTPDKLLETITKTGVMAKFEGDFGLQIASDGNALDISLGFFQKLINFID